MLTINYIDYRLVDFIDDIQSEIPKASYSEEWFKELNSISSRIRDNKLEDKITLDDSKVSLLAYRVMLKAGTQKASMREWAVFKKFCEEFLSSENEAAKQAATTFTNLYISEQYMGGTLSDAEKESLSSSKEILKLSGLEFPVFVSNELNGISSNKKQQAGKPEEYEDDILKEWANLRDFCETAIADTSTSKKDLDMYEVLLNTVSLFV